MADISDVEQAVAMSVAGVLYPQGSSGSSIVGTTCRIFRGWPNPATLNSDLRAGTVNVTVIADNHSGRTTTRYLQEWQSTVVSPSLTASVIGPTVSIAGVAAIGNVVGILVDGLAYTYRINSGDTPGLVAANLCTAIQVNHMATAHGPSVNIPGATSVIARVVCDSNAEYEGRRQEKDVRVICWCPTPATRDSVAAAIDLAIAQNPFLLLPDNAQARVEYRNTTSSDQSQNALLYRRDLVYCIEYPTLILVDLPSMLFGAAAINGQTTFG